MAASSQSGTNIALNFLLIPAYGIVGAAWANGAAYAVQAGLGYAFSQRFYPIAYEWGRIVRACLAGIAAYAAASMLPSVQLTVREMESRIALPGSCFRITLTLLAELMGVSGKLGAPGQPAQISRESSFHAQGAELLFTL